MPPSHCPHHPSVLIFQARNFGPADGSFASGPNSPGDSGGSGTARRSWPHPSHFDILKSSASDVRAVLATDHSGAFHSACCKFWIRIKLQEAATIAAKSADRNSVRKRSLCSLPERLLRRTLMPAAHTTRRVMKEIRNESLNHRSFALRALAWFAHIPFTLSNTLPHHQCLQ